MATIFFVQDRLAKEWNEEFKHFSSVEEAQSWAKNQKRWFKATAYYKEDVTEHPLYLEVVSDPNQGCVTTHLEVTGYSSLSPDKVLDESLRLPGGLGFHKGQRLGTYVSGAYQTATVPSRIEHVAPEWATLAYILLGGCKESVPGVDMPLAQQLLAEEPAQHKHAEYPALVALEQELKAAELAVYKARLVKRSDKERVEALKASIAALRTELRAASVLARNDWHKKVIRLLT